VESAIRNGEIVTPSQMLRKFNCKLESYKENKGGSVRNGNPLFFVLLSVPDEKSDMNRRAKNKEVTVYENR